MSPPKRSISLLAHDIRSAYNVGSLIRTAEGLGVKHLYLTGYSPYPPAPGDVRLPHEQARAGRMISKTSLGAERSLGWSYHASPEEILRAFRADGISIAALEQSRDSIPLPDYTPPREICLIIGNEVEGVPRSLIELAGTILEIPMAGQKESFNVVQAAAMAVYHLTFSPL